MDPPRNILFAQIDLVSDPSNHQSLHQGVENLTCFGLSPLKLHAIAHLLVLPPCTNSLMAQFCTPALCNRFTKTLTLLSFPSMLVYH